MNVFDLYASLGLKTKDFTDGLNAAHRELESFGNGAGSIISMVVGTVQKADKAITTISDGAVSFTAKMVTGAAQIAKAVDENVMGAISRAEDVVIGAFQAMASEGVAFFKDVMQEGIEFDAAMGQVGATMMKSKDEFDEITVSVGEFTGTLTEYAQKLGAETIFTSTQVGEAMNYITLSGRKAQETAELLPHTLDLAAAGTMDLGVASEMVTQAVNALGLEEEDVTRLIDQMAMTSTNSGTTIAQLGDGILTIGATARDLKGGITELNTALGVLADNGIQASEGGNMLRRVLTRLTAGDSAAIMMETLGVSAYDAQGNMKGLQDIFMELNQAMAGFTDQQRKSAITDIFGQYSLAGANALLNTTTERWQNLTSAIEDSEGAAAKVAEVQRSTLKGQIQLLDSAYSGVKTNLFSKIAGISKEFVETLSTGLSNVAQEIKEGNFFEAFMGLGETAVKLIKKGITLVLENSTTIDEIIRGAVEFIKKVGSALFEGGSKLLPQLLGHLLYFSQQIITNLSDFLSNEENIKTIEDTVSHLFEQLKTFFNKNQDKLYNIFSTMVDLGIEFIDDLFVLKREIIYNILSKKVLEILEDLPGKVREWLESDGLKENVNNIIAFIGELLQVLLDSGASIALQMTDFIINIADKLMTTLSDFLLDPENKEKIRFVIAYILTSIEEFLDRNEDIIYLIFSEYFDLAVGFAVKVWDLKRETTAKLIIRKFKELFKTDIGTNLIDGIFEAAFPAGGFFRKVSKVVEIIVKDFKEAFGIHSPSTVFRDEIGDMLIKGLWQGINSAKDWLIDKIGGFTDSVTSAFKDFFGIQSPSKLMRDEVGKFMAEGIGVGFTKEMDKVTEDMQKALPTTFDVTTTVASTQKAAVSPIGGTIILNVDKFINNSGKDLRELAEQLNLYVFRDKAVRA